MIQVCISISWHLQWMLNVWIEPLKHRLVRCVRNTHDMGLGLAYSSTENWPATKEETQCYSLWNTLWQAISDPHILGKIHMKGRNDLQKYLMAIDSTLQKFQTVFSKLVGLDTPAYPFQPGDWVCVGWWDSDLLQAKWKRLFQVLLTTLTADKVAGKGSWIHFSRAKENSAPKTIGKTETDTNQDDVV